MGQAEDRREALHSAFENDPEALAGIPSRKERSAARRSEALSLRMAGFSYKSIAERMDLSVDYVRTLVRSSIDQTQAVNVAELRDEENARLDRIQATVWGKAVQGDEKAIEIFLRISDRRARLNGLNAPTKIDMSVSVRQELDTALRDLENMVLPGEVVNPHLEQDHDPAPRAIGKEIENLAVDLAHEANKPDEQKWAEEMDLDHE